MAIASLFPAIKPSLNLDFANTKSLDPRITFTRPTGATYYDGKTVAKAEENLFLNSQNFLSTWSVSAVSAATSSVTAPDGTATSHSIAETATTSSHFIHQASNFTLGIAYTVSIYAKKGSGASAPDVVQMTLPSSAFGTSQYANFNISAGTVLTSTGGTANISNAGSGWFRLSFTATATVTASGNTPCIVFCNNSDAAGRTPNYLGSSTSDVLVWGAQLEQRSQATAYTPTTTQPITNYIPVLQTAPAGVPRFDHNPVTGESLGLLVEEQRTNLMIRGQEFDNLSWGKVAATVSANALIAPDGTLSADKLIADTSLSSHRADYGVTVAQNSSYTFSCFCKAGEYGGIAFNIAGGSSSATFNLVAGNLTSSGNDANSTLISTAIQHVGNGWYRCSFSFTWLSAAITATSIRICLSSTATSTNPQPTFTGDGYSGIYIWGAQLEAGAFPTSYIKTDASQVTRAADSASMTGANFSSWYRQDEGTLTYQARYLAASAAMGQVVAALDDSSSSSQNRIMVYKGASSGSIFAYSGVSNVLIGSVTPAVSQKYTLTYDLTTIAGSSGSAVSSTVTSTRPTISSLNLGKGSNANQFSGHIARISYYPKRLTDAQLQALTA